MRVGGLVCVALILTIGIALSNVRSAEAAGGPVSGFAWSDFLGWMEMSGTATTGGTYGVSEDSSTGELSGYAWAPYYGWISFNSADWGGTCPSGSCQAKANLSTGAVVGWARSCGAFSNKNGCSGSLDSGTRGWDGFISLSGTAADDAAYGVQITKGCWSGFAYGAQDIGYISFSGTAGDGSTYQVGDSSCSSGQKCPDLTPAPNNDTVQCTCAQGNTSKCISGCTDPNNCTAPTTGCNIAVAPKSTTVGSAVTLGWASACDSVAAGCTQSVLGISVPVVAGGTSIDQGVGPVSPSSGSNPLILTPLSLPITYTLSGYLTYWPTGIKVLNSDYTASNCPPVTVRKQTSSLCTDESALVDGKCPDNTCAETGYPRCSADLSSFEYLDNACAVQSSVCPYYVSFGYGCVSGACLTPPAPTATFNVQPTLVRFGTSVHVTLDAQNVAACTISSSASSLDGRSLTGLLARNWALSADYQSSPIVGQTIFTLHCNGILDGTSVNKVITVNLVAKFIEQ